LAAAGIPVAIMYDGRPRPSWKRVRDRPTQFRSSVSSKVFVPHPRIKEPLMDKKIKKKLEVLRQRVQKLQQQLSGSKLQNDEPGEVERLEAEIARIQAEVRELKAK